MHNTSKHQGKAKVGRFQSPIELQPNPPGESYQIVLTLHVICMEKTEGWLIAFADSLPIGNPRSLHGVATIPLRILQQVAMDDAFVGQCWKKTVMLALKTDIRVNLLGFSG